MSKKDFFESDPPSALDEKIRQAARSALAENRKAHTRRRILQWLTIPALAMGAAALFVFQSREKENLELAEFAGWHDLDDGDLEMFDDLELIECLDELEEWKDT